jgi:hypothetical protein
MLTQSLHSLHHQPTNCCNTHLERSCTQQKLLEYAISTVQTYKSYLLCICIEWYCDIKITINNQCRYACNHYFIHSMYSWVSNRSYACPWVRETIVNARDTESYPINNRHYPIQASNQGRTEDLSLTCDFLPNLKTFHHLSNFSWGWWNEAASWCTQNNLCTRYVAHQETKHAYPVPCQH